jgi:dCTP deaminase
VHFTAPTVHAGYDGTLTLEIINLGKNDFLLRLGMRICQLVFELVSGRIAPTDTQFTGQRSPAGKL